MDDGLILKRYLKGPNDKYNGKVGLYTHELVDGLTVNKIIKKGYETDTTHILMANGDATELKNAEVGKASALVEKATIAKVGDNDNCVPDLKWVNEKVGGRISKSGDTMTGSLTAVSFIKKDGETAGKSTEVLIADGTTKNINSKTSKGNTPLEDENKRSDLIDVAHLAYWNGAYNSNGSSNLSYYSGGAFGSAASHADTDFATSDHAHNDTYLKLSGGTITGQIIINNLADAKESDLNAPLIIGATDGDHMLIDNNKILSVSNRSLKDLWLNGARVDSSGGVHGAVWNDLVDKIIVPENTKLEYGKCYYTNGKEYKQTDKYCQKGIIGIHSDTFGFSMGNIENEVQLNVAVAGFVLAFTDKKYKSGTPLTCTKNGYLTKISLWDKIIYPERIVGTYWKDEFQEEWNGIKVNNRNWIKIK